MDTEKVFSKVKELGHIKSKREELQDYCKQHFDIIIKFLPHHILDRDGSDILDCLFNGLSGDNHSSKHKIKCVDIVLQTLRQNSMFLRHCSDVTSRLCLELPQLPPYDLVRWNNDSVKSIIDDNDSNMIWRDIVPECLSALSAQPSVRHSGTEMSPAEYKNRCVNTLCAHTNYREKQLVQLTAMFTDMQLSREDHKAVVTLLCSYILNFPPDTLPPLVHQLLKLCKLHHIDIVLCHLNRYFASRLYSRLQPPATDSEATTVDIDDITEHSPAELSRCLSTCIYHITKGSADPELIKKHIKIWPKTELLKSPFIIDVALAMSDKGPDFRSVCLNAIKLAIEQREQDGLLAKEAAWARAVLPADVNVAELMKFLTTESANHRELTVVGLINLAFILLSTGARTGRARGAGRHKGACSLGTLLLVRLARAQPNTAQHILSRLGDCLADQQQRQYTECLHALASLSPASVERSSALAAILEGAQGEGGAHIFQTVQPLIGFSTRIRDTLVMVCRKGMYSRDSTHRCLALTGFLVVLRNIKLSRSFSASQNGSEPHSGHSYLTQLTVDVHSSYLGDGQSTSRVKNEAVCMEVVSILRRCLGQDAAVKQLLYTKLFDCTKDKAGLHESILELLHDQLGRQLPTVGLLGRAVKVAGHTAVLQEPIGHLIYTVAQFLSLQNEDEELEDMLSSQVDVGGAHLQSKLMLVLEELSKGEQFKEIDMNEEPGLTDLTPESKAKALMVQQAILCYEALIAHHIMQWKTNSDQAATVYKLYKDCANLLEQTKAPPKVAKKASKSNLSQKSQKSQKDKGKAPVKASNLVKERAGPFKPLPCLWDLNFCHRLIQLLYNETVPYCTVESSNQLRSKRDFHLWSLKCISSAIPFRIDKKSCLIVANIAKVLYKRCISRFEDMCRFDEQTTIGCIDLFRECLVTLLSPDFGLKLNKFLPIITDQTEASNEHQIATILEKLHAALIIDTEEQDNDVINKKMTQALTHTVIVLLEVPVHSDVTHAVLAELEDYIRSTHNECQSLIPAVLAAGAREGPDATFLDDLLDKLGSALGFIDEEDSSMPNQETSQFPSIDARTGQGVLVGVCGALQARGRGALLMLARGKAVDDAGAYRVREDTELQDLYKAITVQLCLLSRWWATVGKLRVSVGVGSAAVLAAGTQLYGLLAKLARQIKPALAQRVRFERLLKLSGKKLSQVTDNLIIYLEGSQQDQDAKKVLRDTKLIPRLVMETEQFRTEVIELGKKAKVDYEQYLSLGTARDFRIRAPALRDALQREQDNADQNRDDENINDDVSTQLQSPPGTGQSGDGETSQRKRRRVS